MKPSRKQFLPLDTQLPTKSVVPKTYNYTHKLILNQIWEWDEDIFKKANFYDLFIRKHLKIYLYKIKEEQEEGKGGTQDIKDLTQNSQGKSQDVL